MSFIFIYTLLLPIGFILPLLIFRKSMNSRIRLIIQSQNNVSGGEEETEIKFIQTYSDKANSETINKLRNLQTTPIDNLTLSKFVVLFVFSVLPIGLLLYNYFK